MGHVTTFELSSNVSLSRDGSDWIAQSTAPADGSVELRFHDAGGGLVLPTGRIQDTVAGIVQGTAAQARFAFTFAGADSASPATLTGQSDVASNPIVFGYQAITGSVVLTDNGKTMATCSTIYEWSLTPGP